MEILNLSRYSLIACMATTLASCGALRQAQDDTQPPIAAREAMPEGQTARAFADRGGSWMLPAAKRADLLYVSEQSRVQVRAYPSFRIMGKLAGFRLARGECVDSARDVYVVDQGSKVVLEYAHGGTAPIATFPDPYTYLTGCAVDPTTGDLAVTDSGGVAIFQNPSTAPTYYDLMDHTGLKYGAAFPSYDDRGDLFVDGQKTGESVGLVELPQGSGSFKNIAIKGFANLFFVGGMQWDGKTLALGGVSKSYASVINRVRITGKTGHVVGTTTLASIIWYHWSDFYISASTLIVPCFKVHSRQVLYYDYPKGGSPSEALPTEYDNFAAVVSRAR